MVLPIEIIRADPTLKLSNSVCFIFWQVWFRVNGLLPDELQKSLPNRPPEMQQQGIDGHEGENIFPKSFIFIVKYL